MQLEQEAEALERERRQRAEEKRLRMGKPTPDEVLTRQEREARMWAFMYVPSLPNSTIKLKLIKRSLAGTINAPTPRRTMKTKTPTIPRLGSKTIRTTAGKVRTSSSPTIPTSMRSTLISYRSTMGRCTSCATAQGHIASMDRQ